jgi:hypothetical protein
MEKQEAEQFEQALQQADQGEPVMGRLAPLVHTARQMMTLSETPPPPPHGLMPGRQRFLAEAARLRAESRGRPLWLPSRRQRLAGVMRLAAALAAIAILFGVMAGVVQASAASLPGQPLYGVKLATERIQLALTSQPASRAALERAMAEERLDEIVALLQRQQAIGSSVSNRAMRQLEQALAASAQLQDPAAAQALQQLAEAIRQREQAMLGAAGELPEPLMRELLREMERVRQEAHAGQGDPDGLRRRLRQGAPTDTEPTGQPGATQVPQSPSPSGTPGPAHTPQHTGSPGQTPGAGATSQPTGGPQASRTPEPSATSQTSEPPHPSRTPGADVTPGPTGGPNSTPGPGQTPGQGGNGGNKP